MDSQEWLPLSEYAAKYRVSVSTLRRRIKAEDIHYRFDDGKYFIFDEPLSNHRDHRPSPMSEIPPMMKEVDTTKFSSKVEFVDDVLKAAQSSVKTLGQTLGQSLGQTQVPQQSQEVIAAANRLLSELKQAYTRVLHEKEEQILNLREEVSDLKTLVKVLEGQFKSFGVCLETTYAKDSDDDSVEPS